ncbi:MAG: PH domain-containing protein [Promethearchaeota archaeon]
MDTRSEFSEYFELQPEEKIIIVLKRTQKSYFLPKLIHYAYFWTFILLYYLIAVVTIGSYIKSLENEYFTDTSIIMINVLFYTFIVSWIIVASIQMIIGYWFVRGHTYVITTDRIIMIRKFLAITYREIDYKRITDIVLHQSLWGRIWNFGVLMPVTAGIEIGMTRMGTFSIEGVKDVFYIRKIIMDQIKIFQDKLRKKYIASSSIADTENNDSPESDKPKII